MGLIGGMNTSQIDYNNWTSGASNNNVAAETSNNNDNSAFWQNMFSVAANSSMGGYDTSYQQQQQPMATPSMPSDIKLNIPQQSNQIVKFGTNSFKQIAKSNYGNMWG